jgi:hypothetical protein
MLHRSIGLGTAAASSSLPKRHSCRLTKFADELSGARHFKVPLYPIEGHLASAAARGPTD